MSKIVYYGISSKAQKIKSIYIGNDTSKKVKAGYVGVDGVAKKFFDIGYSWDRYQVNTTYRWGKYEIATSYRYKYAISSGRNITFSARSVIHPLFIGSATSYTFNEYSNVLSFNGYQSVFYGSSYSTDAEFLSDVAKIMTSGRYITHFKTWMPTGGLQSCSCNNLTLPNDGSYGSKAFYKINSFTYDTNSYGYATRVTIGCTSYSFNTNGSTAQQISGSYIEDVTSASSSAYPANGVSGSYWYVSKGSESSKGNYIDTVTSENYNQYPDDGIQGGYWYVRK